MCELLGISANKKIHINDLLETFYSHSVEHMNGWGLAFFDDSDVRLVKEAVRAIDSENLKKILSEDIYSSRCMAHIRKATIGDIEVKNSHPFTEFDESGRQWVLMHNGTIFESDVLAPYQYTQEGMTDSERILLYIVDVMNKFYLEGGQLRDGSERIEVIDEIIRTITPGNKVNLMIYDGEYFYVHKNEAKTLYSCQDDGGVVFATKPLDDRDWEEIELNRLLVFKDGKLIYRGIKHDNTYEHSDERMKQLYLAYSQL